jgi:hypothetical protein
MNEMSTIFSALLVFVAQIGVASPVDFDRDIHPLLADHCYQCHGPDAKQRQAGLRLDLQEGLFRVEKDVSIVVPGKPDQSELIRRITHPDPTQRMPPAETRSTLSREQIDLVRRWIQGGASWKGHWSLQPFRPLFALIPVLQRPTGEPIVHEIRSIISCCGNYPGSDFPLHPQHLGSGFSVG